MMQSNAAQADESLDPAERNVDRWVSGGAPGWTAVGLLGFLFAVSFVDRMILALLIDPIRLDLGVSETQLGLVFGAGFSVAYVLAGLPLAHFADRGNRRALLIMGVLIWSISTFLAGFANSFATLLMARAGVGIGEAVLTPVAVSIIADLFAPDRRALPTSIYSAVGGVMASGSLIVGGAAVWLAAQLSPALSLTPWRLTFMIVALPGVLGALAFAWLVPEPKRREAGTLYPDDVSVRTMVKHLLDHRRLYAGMFLGVGFMFAQSMGLIAWGPTMLVRQHGLSVAEAGGALGSAAVIGAVVGTLSVPLVLRYLKGMEPASAIVAAGLGYALLSVPVFAFAITSSNLEVALAAIAIGMFGTSASAVLPSLLVQTATPPRLRARAMAVYLLLSSFLGLALGPFLVSRFAQNTGAAGLSGALAINGWAMLAIACGCYLLALFRKQQRDRRAARQQR